MGGFQPRRGAERPHESGHMVPSRFHSLFSVFSVFSVLSVVNLQVCSVVHPERCRRVTVFAET
jgi:hypothetical protein